MFANGSPFPERSARRNATVTNSVPLATSASRISSFDANFPVPTINREVNSRSAIFSLEGLSAIAKHKRLVPQSEMAGCDRRTAIPTKKNNESGNQEKGTQTEWTEFIKSRSV